MGPYSQTLLDSTLHLDSVELRKMLLLNSRGEGHSRMSLNVFSDKEPFTKASSTSTHLRDARRREYAKYAV